MRIKTQKNKKGYVEADAKKEWMMLSHLHSQFANENMNTISISETLLSLDCLPKIFEKAKQEGYRPFGFGYNGKTVVVNDKEEKASLGPRFHQNILTLSEFFSNK